MSLLESFSATFRKFTQRSSALGAVKSSMEPVNPAQIKLPSDEILKSYESRYEGQLPARTPIDTLREPQAPVRNENAFPLPVQQTNYNSPVPYAAPKAPVQNNFQPQQSASAIPKIDLILAEIETVKAQLKVLSEKLDVIEGYFRKPAY